MFGIGISCAVYREICESCTHASGARLLLFAIYTRSFLFMLLCGLLASSGIEERPLARGEVVVLLVAFGLVIVAVGEISGAGEALAFPLLGEGGARTLLLLLLRECPGIRRGLVVLGSLRIEREHVGAD